MRLSLALLVLALGACGSPATSDSGQPDAAVDSGSGNDGSVDGGSDAAVDAGADSGVPDGGMDASTDAGLDAGTDAGLDAGSDAGLDAGVDGGADAGRDAGADAGSWRSSLSVCWTDATCRRVMAIAHGGLWDTTTPYDSNGAIAAAYAGGLDGVKIDVRVTSDNVPVISHSSPIELYESVDCYNQRIENMTAAQVTACHRFPSTTERFQRLDDVLNYLRGKMTVQLCVKRSADYGRTITAIHALNAEDFAFIELGNANELQTLIPTLPGSGTVWYLVNVASNLPDVDLLLNTINNPRAFMYEFDPGVAIGNIISTRLHPAGIRAFTYDSSSTASVGQLKAYFDQGYDVVSANAAANAATARIQTNQARGISPP